MRPLGILVAVVVALSPNIARSQGQPQSTPPQISYAEFITLDYAARRLRFAEDNRQALNDVLGQLRGDVTRSETVVFLGDYIDRGPDSRGCIDAILEFQHEVTAAVVCLRGNHEDWFLQTRRDYSRHSWLLGWDGGLRHDSELFSGRCASLARGRRGIPPCLTIVSSVLRTLFPCSSLFRSVWSAAPYRPDWGSSRSGPV